MLTITITAAVERNLVIGDLPFSADTRTSPALSITEAHQISAQLASHGWTSAPKGWAHRITCAGRKVTREVLADAAEQVGRHGEDFAASYLASRLDHPTFSDDLSFGQAVDALGGQASRLSGLSPRALDVWEAALRTA